MALLPAAYNISKASQRLALDFRAKIPKPLATALTSPRIWTIRKWLLLCVTISVVLILRNTAFGHSHQADIVHLDHLMRKFSDAEDIIIASQEVTEADTRLEPPHNSLETDVIKSSTDSASHAESLVAELAASEDAGSDADTSIDEEDLPDDSGKDQYGRDIPHYREIFSITSRDRKYYNIWWNGERTYNPNLIPHPTEADKWIVVAQKEQYHEEFQVSAELVCTASFAFGALMCNAQPTELPTAPSIIGNCQGDLALGNLRTGPRDARMFNGPNEPYLMWGSQSSIGCFGLWLQDARMLLEPYRLEQRRVGLFRDAMELRRPEPWHVIEKNYFIFWDAYGQSYVHHDLWPKRVFAQLNYDGGAGPDLGPAAAGSDARCMASFMPTVHGGQESIHQATNSLSITLCKRADPRCIPTDDNTFVMHIFHWKSFYEFHGGYEPCIMLFKRTAPFSLHAISQRPFWIHGRTDLTEASSSPRYRKNPQDIPPGHTEFFYVTSMSWKRHGLRYHGYIDDIIFLAFGVEDAKSGAIDVTAGDLLQDLAFCELSMPE